jgi:hypothetical protein
MLDLNAGKRITILDEFTVDGSLCGHSSSSRFFLFSTYLPTNQTKPNQSSLAVYVISYNVNLM